MTKEWNYSGAWDSYPIQDGDIWVDSKTGSIVQAIDLFSGLPEHMREADMLYIDPPWNTGNINSFYTKAGMQDTRRRIGDFFDVLFSYALTIKPDVLYVEIGKQALEDVIERVGKVYPVVQHWGITYYKKLPCFLVRGAAQATDMDYTGMDDSRTPYAAVESESPTVVGDLCTGRGLIAEAAIQHGKKFVGTELNKKRLAETLAVTANRFGCSWQKS